MDGFDGTWLVFGWMSVGGWWLVDVWMDASVGVCWVVGL